MAGTMNTVDASAGKRLGAWLLDTAPLAILSAIFLSVLGPQLLQESITPGTPMQVALSGALFTLLTLGYTGFLWWWEASAGKTLGNVLLKLRTTAMDGTVPGWTPVIQRRLLIVLAGIVPIAGPVLVVVSNLFDPQDKRQGWHDKAAGTLVLDIDAGYDPLGTGGLAGQQAFAPSADPAASDTASGAPAQSFPRSNGVITSVPGASHAPGTGAGATPGHSPEAAPEAAPEPIFDADAAPTAAPTATPVPEAHPDDAFTHTRLRVETRTVTRLIFDDGQVHELEHSLLIGRNPSAASDVDDTDDTELLRLGDGGRSVSKTHLLVQPSSSGIWVTDRNSTNGSRVIDAAGTERDLLPGQPSPAAAGDTVYLGERHFTVERT
ncbi:RDD family protein [Paeniglutamicibacter terrestris]|uniref:FHA domain-containing protein n=1 Tax=Paeniglutamicibacter terrestris TaxID=2723403 RepID=A0ABX1G5G5_9MICC|nr:FHA domain-containing protein [Paeniglutamicibacter terrestris]